MKIEISKTQYKTLVKALFLANWVVNCHETDEPDDEFERLEQYILSQGKFFDLKNVEFDEKHGKYYHESDFEMKTVKLLDDFVDISFWDELTERLAERDFVSTLGEKAILKMSQDERFTKFYEFADSYEAEFAENGIDNLVLRSDSKE
jgi:hypothetical protein